MSWALLAYLALSPDAGPALTPESLVRPVVVAADRLEVFAKERKAVYTGNARATRDSTTINCERLTVSYSGAQEVEQVLAEGGVEVVDGDLWAKGERADFDNRTGLLVMTGEPRAKVGRAQVAGSKVRFTAGSEVLEVEEARTLFEELGQGPVPKGRVTVDARRLEVYASRNEAVWSGKARALRGPTEILAERLVAHYGEDREIRRLEATGGVEVRDQGRWAKGGRADFDNGSGVLVVTGEPEARQGPNHMRGTRVTFTVGQDALEVENARTVIRSERLPFGGKR
ncbi:MAG: hypothetical protein HYZ28_06070 [Myxococcales bacterium]|nr:hypothetical protein [Myxococcales bacterium]